VSVIEPHVKLPTYNTLKMQVGIDNGQYSVELYATNLTNERGITAFANSGGYNQTGTAQFIQPRTIGFQLGAKF
jgi:outer membrane receptor protein involved in Fe transport